MDLYIDIETIPTQRDKLKQVVTEGISPPGNISKAETIEKWNKEKRPAEEDKVYRKTALDGAYGEIICIGWAIDDNECRSVYRDLGSPESILLENFFKLLQKDLAASRVKPFWIGHNIEFDLKFIWHRCVINQIKPSVYIPHNDAPWKGTYFDTMKEWHMRNYISLDGLSLVMGLEEKTMDGSQVWDKVQEGDLKAISDYCIQDVELTRKVHKRMTFGK